MEKPRILLMYEMLTEMGGIESLMATHSHMLLRAGYKVKLLFGDIDSKLAANEIYKGLDLIEYGSKVLSGPTKLIGSIIGANKLKEIIKPEDIIISYSFPINVTLRNFKNTKINFCNHYPNWLYLPIKERWKWANNINRKIAFAYSLFLGPITKNLDKKYVIDNSIIFVNSNFTKKKLDPLYDINGIVSYPPVNNIFKYTPNNETLKKYNINTPYIFASGRLIKDKHVDLLLEAYTKSKQILPLIISGKGTELEYLKKLTVKLNIQDKVKFIGFVTTEELINLYSMAEIYLMPTKQEDFGLATAEALNCNVPLVVWDDGGGSCEQCIDGINGYKAKPYDTTDFARCIDRCLEEDFKKTHKKDILKSAEIFSEATQENIFVGEINKLLNRKP